MDLRAYTRLQIRVRLNLRCTQTRGYIFSFKVCKIAMHSCAEQAAGSYSRPGNIHEFFPSPSHRYFINALLEFQDPPHHYG